MLYNVCVCFVLFFLSHSQLLILLFFAETATVALRATFRLNAENLIRRILGIEPQKRWGALLDQQPPLEFVPCSIYVPLESDFESAHHFQGEQLYFILEISIVILGCSGESNSTGNELSTVDKDDTMVVSTE